MIIDNDYCKTEITAGRTGWQVAFYSREIGGRFGVIHHVKYAEMGRTLSKPRPTARDTRLTHEQAIEMLIALRQGMIGRMLRKGDIVR